MIVEVSKDCDRGITLSRLIFCRSKADGVKDQPLLGQSTTAKHLFVNSTGKTLQLHLNQKRWSVVK